MDNQKYLIAVDLDDTILKDLRTLEKHSVKALKAVSKKGHKVMIATARPLCIAKPHYDTLNLDTPICLLNGAQMVSFEDERFSKRKNYLTEEHLKQLFSCIPSSTLEVVWMENNDDLYITGVLQESSYFDELYQKSNLHPILISNLPIMEVGRLFFWLKDDEVLSDTIQKMKQIEGIHLSYRKWGTDGNYVLFSIRSTKADKWYCVKAVADYYHIPQENILTFGDEMNDAMMLAEAGNGFAMRNGNPKLKQLVKHVTQESNDKGGVGKEINRFFQLGLALE